MNPLLNIPRQSVQPQNTALQGLVDTIKFAQTFKSPQAFLQVMQRENPQMYQYLMQLNQQIRNPMAAAAQMLNNQGINPQQLSAMLN